MQIKYHIGRPVRKAVEEPVQPAPEQGKKLDTKELLSRLQDQGGALSLGFTLGLALALVEVGLPEKKDLQSIKPTDLTSNLNTLLKLILAQRKDITAELRNMWRFGPKKYLYRRGTELRK